MKKLKYTLFLLLFLVMGVSYVRADFDCTYYVWDNRASTKPQESIGLIPLFRTLDDHEAVATNSEGKKIVPKLRVTGTSDAITNVEILDSNILEAYAIDSATGLASFYLPDNSSISLKLWFSREHFSNGSCPVLGYDYKSDAFNANYTFDTDFTSDGYFISTEPPINLPDDYEKIEDPNAEEKENYKYCSYNYLIKDRDTSEIVAYYKVLIQRTNDPKTEDLDLLQQYYKYYPLYVAGKDEDVDFNQNGYMPFSQATTYYINREEDLNTKSYAIHFNLEGQEELFEDLYDGTTLRCLSDVKQVSSSSENITTETPESIIRMVDGTRFQTEIQVLQGYLQKYALYRGFSPSLYGNLTIAKVDTPFPWYEKVTNLPVDNLDLEARVKAQMGKVVDYCANLYNGFDRFNHTYNVEGYEVYDRLDECISFDEFYSDGVKKGIFEDYTSDCAFVSKDLLKVLKGILTIIKIAGPIIALGFGVLDFIRTVAAGDADKEMKNTFKRFMIRIGSAILLLIIPIIISFLLDVFLGNKDGYNPDNPFCNAIDWSELK